MENRKVFRKVTLLVLTAVVFVGAMILGSCSHTHMYSEMRVLKPATCSEKGQLELTCECGDYLIEEIEFAEHIPGEHELSRAATCTADGTERVLCIDCGQVLQTTTLPKLGHDIVKVEKLEPTCAEAGHEAYEFCTRCDHSTYIEIDKTRHTPGEPADCVNAQRCLVCETVIYEAMGHVELVTEGKEATCSAEGLTDKIECERCKKIIQEQIPVPKKAHIPVSVEGRAATCIRSGLSAGVECSVCDEKIVRQVTIPTINHTYSSTSDESCNTCSSKRPLNCKHENLHEYTKVYASCNKYGLTAGKECKDCGYIFTARTLIPADDHKVKVVKGYSATLTKPGLTDGTECSVCKLIIREQKVIDPIGRGSSATVDPRVYNGGDLAYKVNYDNTTCTVTGIGTCTSNDIIVPEFIDAYEVTGIGKEAFLNCKLLVSIVIPETVKEIGDKAFSGCTALVDIEMPDEVDIGIDVFRGSIHVEVTYRHELVFVPAKAASCTAAGNVAHYMCNYCKKYYSDAEGAIPLYSVLVSASHSFSGSKCTSCGVENSAVKITSVEAIPYLGKFALGTMEDAIGLPSSVKVKTGDGKEHTLNVIWDLSNYHKNILGKYTIKGHVQAGQFFFGAGVSSQVVAEIEVVEYMQGTADIVFVIDTTGSMSSSISNVKNNVIGFAQALEKQGVSARWGLVDFDDLVENGPDATKIVMNGSSQWFVNATEYKNAVGSLTASGGGSVPEECAIDGLMMATTLTTRTNARTFYILVTDVGTRTNNNFGVKSVNELAQILDDKGVYVSVVAPTNKKSVYGVLTDTTGGVYADISGNFQTTLFNKLVDIIQQKVTD